MKFCIETKLSKTVTCLLDNNIVRLPRQLICINQTSLRNYKLHNAHENILCARKHYQMLFFICNKSLYLLNALQV